MFIVIYYNKKKKSTKAYNASKIRSVYEVAILHYKKGKANIYMSVYNIPI